jgi:transcription elongation factor SPT6
LWVEKLMEKTVYINSIGFIKINENNVQDKEEFDILDTTRIHPENYVLAKKIAKDALDDDKID